jgi:hypothetical protein
VKDVLFHVDRRTEMNLAEGNRLANVLNTRVGYELKIVVFERSETDATSTMYPLPRSRSSI